MQIYVRLTGIEIDGATDGLKLLPVTDVMNRVLNIYGSV